MGFLFERRINPQIRLGLWEIVEGEEAFFNQISLTSDERAALEMLKSSEKQIQRLAYRAVLTKITGKENFIIQYDAFRKPHLQGYKGHISVSHSGELAAAIFNQNNPVGIDVERVSPRILPISKRFLSAQELDECGPCPDPMQLTLYWSAKEALFKLEGKRFLSFGNDIYVSPFTPGMQGTMTGNIKRGSLPGIYELAWETYKDYVLVYTL